MGQEMKHENIPSVEVDEQAQSYVSASADEELEFYLLSEDGEARRRFLKQAMIAGGGLAGVRNGRRFGQPSFGHARNRGESSLSFDVSESGVGIIVLAAGASTRLGQPKQLLRYEGETLLRRAVNAALNSQCHPIIVVLGSDAETIRDEIADTEARIVINPAWTEGMASSIRCGLTALESSTAEKAQAAILMLCDQPLVTSEVIHRLLETFQKEDQPIVASTYTVNGEVTYGVPALFSRTFFPELLKLQGVEGAKRVIAQHRNVAAIIASPEAAVDVDTLDDYQALPGTNM